MKSKRLISKIIAATIVAGSLTPAITAKAVENKGEFKNSISSASKKQWTGKKFESKPLIILMDYKDYNHKDIFNKETWNVNGYNKNQNSSYLYSPQYYKDRFFGDDTYKASDGNNYITIKKYLQEESGDSYIFNGDVAGWYKAKYNADYYGANNDKSGSDQNNATKLVIEALEAVAKDSKIDLSKYDVEDKWDYDHDGDYHEPDGIIDTLVVLHSGIGEEHGGGSLGEKAIWPFRGQISWYEASNYNIPEVTDYKGEKWKSEDFTVFSQDLPMDLFAHEYGHVLGLDDLYDTNGSEPPVQYWSLMGGSYTGPIRGVMPNSYGAYGREKLQKSFKNKGYDLNWQKEKEISLEQLNEKGVDVTLDQSSIKGENYNTIKVKLPDKDISTIAVPNGRYAYFSGKGDNLKNSMTANIDLKGKKSARLEFSTWYDIDPEYDFLSVQVKEEGSDKWVSLKGNFTTDKNPNDETPDDKTDRNPGHAITGTSSGKWVLSKYNLSQYAGKKIQLKFYFWTDGNTPKEGAYLDDIKVFGDEKIIFSDGAEGDSKFNLEGFTKTDGKKYAQQEYLLEWRNSENGLIDQGLSHFSQDNWETVKYDAGLLVWYMNKGLVNGWERADQNTKEHPKEAYASVIDADQDTIKWEMSGNESGVDRVEFQMHDAAFGLSETSPLDIHWSNNAVTVDKNTFMNPVFEDVKDYTNKDVEGIGTKLPQYGLKFFVTDESKDRSSAKVHITKENTKVPTYQDASVLRSIEVNNRKLFVETKEEFADKAHVSYIVTKDGKPETKNIVLKLKNGKYEGDLESGVNSDNLQISQVILHDKIGNAKAIYNINLYKVFGADLKLGKTSNNQSDTDKENDNKKDEDKNKDTTSKETSKESLDIKYLNTETKFKKDTSQVIRAKVTNNSNVSKTSIIIVGVYDKNNKLVMLNKANIETILPNTVKEIECNIKVPSKEGCTVKAFVWDSEDSIRPIGDEIEFKIIK